MDMFHLVFSGPETKAAEFVEDLVSHGFPARIDRLCAGFESELLVSFVEALGDGYLGERLDDGTLDGPLGLAEGHGFRLRMHGTVTSQAQGDPLADRVAALEARIAELTK